MSQNTTIDDNSLLKRYCSQSLRGDLSAALAVAFVALPQSMAVALLADVNPAYGLYTAVVSAMVGSALGSSRHLVTGPTSVTSVMFASVIAHYRGQEMNPTEMIFLLTFLVGFFKFLFGVLRLGRLVNYISHSVIIGFTCGAAIIIAGKQLANLFGVSVEKGLSFPRYLWATLGSVPDVNGLSLGIGVGTILFMIICNRINRRIPAAVLVMPLSALLVYLFKWNEAGLQTVESYGIVKRALPPFHMVQFNVDAMRALSGGAVAMAIIGLMEATSISKSVAAQSGQRLNSSREFIGQGLANMVGSYFSNFACSGSFVRTTVNFRNGAQTRMAGIFGGIVLALIILIAGPAANYIPVAALAGILIVVAATMINREQLGYALHAHRGSAVVFFATLIATITIRLDWAIYTGVILSSILYLRQASTLYFALLTRGDEGVFHEIALDECEESDIKGQVIMLNVVGEMFFGAVNVFQDTMADILAQRPKAVILRVRRMRNLGSSAHAALERLRSNMEKLGIPLILFGVDADLLKTLKRTGLADRIGEKCIVPAGGALNSATVQTIALAESLAAQQNH